MLRNRAPCLDEVICNSGMMEMERSSVKNNSGEESELGLALEEDKPVHALRFETGEDTNTDTDTTASQYKGKYLCGAS